MSKHETVSSVISVQISQFPSQSGVSTQSHEDNKHTGVVKLFIYLNW